MMLDDDGNLGFASFRSSPPDLAGTTFPRTGDLIVAELCSWDCDKAMEMLEYERLMYQQSATISMPETLEQDLGRVLLSAIRGAKDGTARFVVPVGSEEVHVEMGLKPLNSHVSPDDPMVLNLMSQLADAVDKVRNRQRQNTAASGPNEREIETLTAMSEPQAES